MNNKNFTMKEIKKSFHSEEPWINIFFFSYITLPLVYLMVNYTKITPNTISIISLLFGIVSALFYLNGYVLLGAISYLTSYIFDATDGKVARLTQSGKVYGAWFDIFIDRLNLTFITTAIAYNSFIETNEINVLILNSIFLGLAFIGFESRYNIDLYKAKNNYKEINDNVSPSRYDLWRYKYQLIKEPISLPEIFLFYMIIAPLINLEFFALIIAIIFLILRIIKQQFFWKTISD